MAKDKKGLGRGLSSLLGSSEILNNDVSRETKEKEAFNVESDNNNSSVRDPSTSLADTRFTQDDNKNESIKNVIVSENTECLSRTISNTDKEVKTGKDGDLSTSSLSDFAQDDKRVSINPEDAPVIIRDANNNGNNLTSENSILTKEKNKKNVTQSDNEVQVEGALGTIKSNHSADEGDPSTSLANARYAQDDISESNNKENNVSRETNENYIKLNVEDIEPNPDQPRRTFDEQKLQELAHSIKDQGVLQPIVVREKDDKYQIIAGGEKMAEAARIAGLKEVPCVLQEANDDKALELALIENIQRDDLNPIEEAYTYKRLMDKLNYTQAELAKAVAKGRSTIANAIRLLDLPEQAQEAMFNEKLTAGHARAVLSVPSPKGRIKLTQKIIEDKLSVREAESLARLLSVNTTSRVRNNRNNVPSAYTAIAKSLKEVLGTQVRIKKTKSGSKLEISFSNEEELRSIYEKLAEE